MPPDPTPFFGAKTEPHSVGFNLAAIMLGVAMVGLTAAYGFTALVHTGPQPAMPTDSGPVLQRTLVGKQLHIPESWFRDGAPAAAGFASRVDLRLQLPLGKAGALAPIGVTLLPLSQVRTSASLLDGVYLHEFTAEELTGPAGLVGKPLDGLEGFEDETVWYDALSQNPFVANCSAPPDGQGPAQCLRTVALSGGIAAVYSFDGDVLEAWKSFDPQMRIWLGRIGAL